MYPKGAFALTHHTFRAISRNDCQRYTRFTEKCDIKFIKPIISLFFHFRRFLSTKMICSVVLAVSVLISSKCTYAHNGDSMYFDFFDRDYRNSRTWSESDSDEDFTQRVIFGCFVNLKKLSGLT